MCLSPPTILGTYNFIQDPLPGPKVQPSREVWTRAIPAFTEVLQKLEPQLSLFSHETSGIKYLPFPKAHLLAFPVAKPRRVDSTNCLTFLEFLLPDQSPKQRWLALQKLVSLRESRNPGSHQCFFDRDTKDRKHMLRLVRGALGPLHRATAFDGEQECRDLHLSGNLQDG
jgi:hypothetical protein